MMTYTCNALSICMVVAPTSIPRKALEGCVTRTFLSHCGKKCPFRYKMGGCRGTKHGRHCIPFYKPQAAGQQSKSQNFHPFSSPHLTKEVKEKSEVAHCDPHPALYRNVTCTLQETWIAHFIWHQNLSKLVFLSSLVSRARENPKCFPVNTG